MKDLVSLKKTITIMLRICIALATAFALVTAVAPEFVMSIYSPEADIIKAGTRYFNWSVASYWLLGMSLTMTIVLRSVGQAWLPLLTSIIAFFVNIGANYIFIFGKFGAPALGVAGAALGTLIARAFEFIMIDGYVFFVDKKIGYRIRDLLGKCSDMLREYLRVSIPVLVSDTLLGLGNSAVAIVMGHIGSSFVSANAITTVTQQLSTVFISGISQSSCMVIGHTLGEGDLQRAKTEGNTFLLLGTAIGILAGGFIMLISPLIISFYNITPETKSIAQELMLAIGLIVVFQSMNSILTKGVMRGGGDTKFLMVADILFLWIVSIPVGAIAGLVLHLPAFWIYVCLKLDQIIKAIWCIGRFRSNLWIKAVHGVGHSKG
jgi:putative MATE family efflux protein